MLGCCVRPLRWRFCRFLHSGVLLCRAPGLCQRVHVVAGVLWPQPLMWLLSQLMRSVGPLPCINHLEACTNSLKLGLHG